LSISLKLLAIIGRRIPAVYDVIPRGPQGRLAEVALNPQPLPPQELGAAIATEFARSVWMADRFGLDPGLAFKDLDDWCPTRPRLPKLPWWPPVPGPDPEPHPEWLIELHLGFAARLAAVASGLDGSRLGESLNKAIERSLEVIETAT
jgi:hypothetical protein